MIKINRIKEEPAGLFFKNDQEELIFLGNIENNLEYQDVCLQIAKENSDRYYILFKEVFYNINRFGMISNYPKGLFDKITDLICDTILTGINTRKAEKDEKQ